jgi:hypothetical protein
VFGGLIRAVAQQELDLLQVAAVPAAQLSAGATKVMGAEAFDADLPDRLLDHLPNRPVAQPLSDPAALADGAQQPALPQSGRRGFGPEYCPDQRPVTRVRTVPKSAEIATVKFAGSSKSMLMTLRDFEDSTKVHCSCEPSLPKPRALG